MFVSKSFITKHIDETCTIDELMLIEQKDVLKVLENSLLKKNQKFYLFSCTAKIV